MNIRSCGSRGPVFSRISTGIAALPTSCSSAASRAQLDLLGRQPDPNGRARGEAGDVPEVGDEGLALLGEHLEEHILASDAESLRPPARLFV